MRHLCLCRYARMRGSGWRGSLAPRTPSRRKRSNKSEPKWSSCSKLLNQLDFQAKRRSGGMADAADSKSVGRKPVKVRLLSPAPLALTAISNSANSFCHSERSARTIPPGNQASRFPVGTRVEESLCIFPRTHTHSNVCAVPSPEALMFERSPRSN